MDVSMLQSPPRRHRTLSKLVVWKEDAKQFNDIFEMITEQNRDIELIFFDKIEEIGEDWSELAFFCGIFHSELYRKLTQNQDSGGTAHLIVGPAALRHRLQTNQEMMSLRPCRPLYCEIMKDVVMKLSSEVVNKRELVELVHFMGGSVRKDTVPRTNVIIAAKTTTKKRSMCFSTLPKLRSTWITECWKHRDDPYFNVLEEQFICNYRLAVFEGLTLFFHGFKQQETDDMVKNLKENGGLMADTLEKATHVVYNSASEDMESFPFVENQFHVTQEWYWVSLHRGSCAYEDNFALPTKSLLKRFAGESGGLNNSPVGKTSSIGLRSSAGNSRSASSMRDCSGEGPSLNATPDYIYSNDDVEKTCKSPLVSSKRMQVCMEMVETEDNYVNLLKLVVKFKTMLEEDIAQNDYMKKSDVAMIFGKLEPILEVHVKISQKLNLLRSEASALLSIGNGKKDDKNLDFAQIWIEMKEEMKRVYPPYLNSYDTAKNLFDSLDRENPKFHTFCKAKESNPEFHRLKLNDLMVKPVQRLPSVILLLKEMGKKSESSKLKASADDAARSVDEVLKIANKTRERNDHLISHMSKFTDIENVPPHLVAANRMFIREMVVMPIASTATRLAQFPRMKLFLFHDVMLITKIRSEKNTMQRLARHASFASLSSRSRRPYKYIEQIPLSSMRLAVKIRPPDDFLKFIDPVFGGREPNLWLLIHRDEGGDIETVFEASDNEEVKEFLDDIHIKILSTHGRIFLLSEPETTSRLEESVAEATLRHFRRQMLGHGTTNMNATVSERTPRNEWSHNLNDSILMGPPQPVTQSKMRRAFSNAQLTIATTLGFGRHQSRNNLGQINENSSMIGSPRVSCDPAALANITTCMNGQDSESTPKRGLRARLTSSTFLNRTLNRNTSMRRQINSEKEIPRPRTALNRVTDL